MTSRVRTVREYIEELEKTKSERTDQVKEGLEIYVDLWKRAVENGVVEETDTVDDALEKIDKNGGLYKAAGN